MNKNNKTLEFKRILGVIGSIKYTLIIINEGNKTGVLKNIKVIPNTDRIKEDIKYFTTAKIIQDSRNNTNTLREETVNISFPITLQPKESIIIKMSFDLWLKDDFEKFPTKFYFSLFLEVIGVKLLLKKSHNISEKINCYISDQK